jgi:hypothetical protein
MLRTLLALLADDPRESAMILSDLATAWINANCQRSDVQMELHARLDAALQRGVGCTFVLGRNLVRSRKPFLVTCYCGELFAFQLTPSQAASLDVDDHTLATSRGLSPHYHESRPEPAVRLVHVELDDATAHQRTVPLEGTLTYQADRLWMTPLALQVVCEPLGRASSVLYHHLNALKAGEQTVRFSLPAPRNLRELVDQPSASVVPVFFQLCHVGEPAKPEPDHLMRHFQLPQPATNPPFAKLGEPYVPPPPAMPPIPTIPKRPSHIPPPGIVTPSPQVFRGISDIRALLVEFA